MKKIITNKFKKHLAFIQKIANWWFKLTKLKFMRGVFRKILKELFFENGELPVTQLQVFPSDFKKLSNKQIEYGLNLFVQRQELVSWKHIKEQEEDGYLVVFPDEKRSQSRFPKQNDTKLQRIPQEINLDEVKIEPIAPPQEQPIASEQEIEDIQKEQELDEQTIQTPTKHKSIWDD